MEDAIFTSNQTLKEVHDALVAHLLENTYASINSKGVIKFTLPENGDCSFWFNDLVEVVLSKAAQKDPEIVKFCINNNIALFDTKLKI